MRSAALPALPRHASAARPMVQLILPPVVLALAMAALVFVVPPLGEFPIDDDWLYARVVYSLVDRGEFDVPAWAATSFVLQAYWGALFAELFGFSHTALRVSTLVVAAVGVLGCFVLLRDLLDTRRALLGALLLLFNPLYVHQAYSFMTDVPFLALALWALVCYMRGVHGPRLSLGWLAVGSALAGAAYLVRQLGAVLPLAVLGSLLLSGGWRPVSQPRLLAGVLSPFLPAVLLGAYLENQRPVMREEPLGWTVAFWAEQSLGMVGVLLARLAGAFSTLGLLTLPLSIGALAGRPALRLTRWQRWLAGGLLLALAVGFVVRGATFGQTLLFPHLLWTLTARGFHVVPYSGTLPESIVIPESVLALVTAAAMLGGGLLVLLIVAPLSPETMHGPVVVPLLFGLLALVATLPYYVVPQYVTYDRYLLPIIPAALLVTLLVFRFDRWGRAVGVGSVAVFAAWSIWWQQEYLERRAALWQAGQALVEQGIPPERINGGREWNGWYRGEAVIAAAAQRAETEGDGRSLDLHTRRGLNMQTPWAVTYALPPDALNSRILAVVPYRHGQRVLAVQRY
jgi:4-amino-4-deoxy-L-arabinose transferase-like glycosyltransferase